MATIDADITTCRRGDGFLAFSSLSKANSPIDAHTGRKYDVCETGKVCSDAVLCVLKAIARYCSLCRSTVHSGWNKDKVLNRLEANRSTRVGSSMH